MVITTTGRKTGDKHSVPIGFIHDDDTYIAINLGGHSNWYLNALASPCVTLEVDAKKFDALAEPISTKTTEDIRQVLDIFACERPDLYKNFFGLTSKVPSDEDLLNIKKRAAFMRFHPIA